MKNILMLDDQIEVIEVIEGLLPNHKVVGVQTHKDFKDKFFSGHFDHYIVDLDLNSSESGIEIVDFLNANSHNGKIIVYSAMSSSQVGKLKNRVDFLLEKPAFDKIKNIVNLPTSVKEMSGEEVFKLMTTTYHHHFRNKLTIIQGKLPPDDPQNVQKSIDFLIELLNDIESQKLMISCYANMKDHLVMDFPRKPA